MGLEQMIRVITLIQKPCCRPSEGFSPEIYPYLQRLGKRGGGDLLHPVSFLMATPVIPMVVKDELDNAKQYFAYKERCVFCDIIREDWEWAKG